MLQVSSTATEINTCQQWWQNRTVNMRSFLCPGQKPVLAQAPSTFNAKELYISPLIHAVRMQLLLALVLCPRLSAKGQQWKSGTACDELAQCHGRGSTQTA